MYDKLNDCRLVNLQAIRDHLMCKVNSIDDAKQIDDAYKVLKDYLLK